MVIRLKPTITLPVLVFLATLTAGNSIIAQEIGNYEPEKTWDGNPDINGIWQAIGTAHWDLQDHEASAGLPVMGAIGSVPPGQGVVIGGEIPYQEWALGKKQENWTNRLAADPETKCYLPGVPRATYLPHPFQVLQGTDKIMIVYGFAEANRTIHMDKENPEPPPLDTWMGRSHGSWEGNTLVVDAQGFNGEAWFDRAGNFASSALRVTERYTPINADALLYEATIEDPTVFTRPWQIRMPLYRRLEPNARVIEYKCVEFSEEILYGHLMKKEEK